MLAGCAAPPAPVAPADDRLTLTATGFDRLPGWSEDTHGAAVPALRRSCGRLEKLPAERSLGAGGIAGRVADWLPVCAAAGGLEAGDAAARVFFETWFVPHLAAAADGSEGLFTGYFEAGLRGSRTPHGPYRVPIHGRPDDLVTADLGGFRDRWKGQRISGRVVDGRLVPYPSRAEIAAGALDGRRLELLWVDDPVDAFFLHIQGSGRVVLDDGRVVRVGFAGRNGHPYVSIGRLLVERREIPGEAVSMQAIRRWIAAHPEQRTALLNANPSYIFFTVRQGDGPIGAQGAVLTPGRSLAVDRRFVPLGVPLWLDTTDPLDPSRPLRRLVVAQDTGAAVKGPVRGDLFWGHGAAAAERAGAMKQTGAYYLLIPRIE